MPTFSLVQVLVIVMVIVSGVMETDLSSNVVSCDMSSFSFRFSYCCGGNQSSTVSNY